VSVSGGCASGLLAHHFRHSSLHFFRGGFRLVRTSHPRAAIGIDDSAAAIGPK
jgi:hypothetical protein